MKKNKFKLLENEQNSHSDRGLYIALVSEKSKVFKFEILYTRHVQQVTLIILIPSFLALVAPVNEEKEIFKLIENEQNSYSDLGI